MADFQLLKVANRTRGVMIASKVRKADNFCTRARGLLFTPPLQNGEGLWIEPCQSIHMFGMQYAIDVIFCDRQKIVVALLKQIKPWQISPVFWQAHSCLELPAGIIESTSAEIGDQLELDEN